MPGILDQAAQQQPVQPPQQPQQPPAGNDDTLVAPEQDAALQQALQFIGQKFYEGNAGKSAAMALKEAQDPVATLADLAYTAAQAADEATGAEIADENLGTLGMIALSEVVEIAEAAGVQLQPSDVASALKQMMLRFLQEQGFDAGQLQQAMNQVSPEQINQLTEQSGAPGAPAAEGEPVPEGVM